MNEKITLPSIVNLLALRSGDSKKQTEDFLKEFFNYITSLLTEGEQLKIKEFGVFKTITVEARKSVNVSTGEDVEIPAHRKVVFIPSKELATIVNEPFDMFETVEMSDEMISEIESSDDGNMHEDIIDDNAPFTEEIESDDTVLYTMDEIGEDVSLTDEHDAHEKIKLTSSISSESENNESLAKLNQESHNELGNHEASNIDDTDAVNHSPSVYDDSISSNETDESHTDVDNSENVNSHISESPEITDDSDNSGNIVVTQDSENSCIESDVNSIDALIDSHKKHSRQNFWIGLLCGVAGVLLLEIILLFSLGYINFGENEYHNLRPVLQKDSVLTTTDNNTEKVGQNVTPKDDKAVAADKSINVDKNILSSADEDVPTSPSDQITYDTISKTRYLTTMAKDHYGNFNLWPYIYEENKSFLGHPDRIKPGTRVVIPELHKYGVNPRNPEDIAKAKKKGIEIYSRYR